MNPSSSLKPEPESGKQPGGLSELWAAFARHELWFWFGLLDIRLRYRRVVLGPWWVTLSLATMVGAMGWLYSTILNVNLAVYLPYFATGMVLWTFIAAQLTESANGFIQFEHAIRHVHIPLPAYLLRILWRNIIVLGHNSVIILAALAFGTAGGAAGVLLAIPGLLILSCTLFGMSLIAAIVCTRYRDFTQVVTVALQMLFFVTPILWPAESLGRHAWAVQINPMFHLVEVVRAPLLGAAPASTSVLTAIGMCLLVNTAAVWLFARHHRKIVFWL